MEHEISLREIVDTIIKGKWLIIIVILIGLLISTLLGLFIISPKYETNSLVKLQESTEEGSVKLDLNAFAEDLKSDVSIDRIIEILKLDQNTYTIEKVRNKIYLEVLKESNVMKIKVTDKDSLAATNIANLLAFEMGSRLEVAENSQKILEHRRNLNKVMEEIEIAKNELSEAQKQLESIPEKQITREKLINNDLLQSIISESTNINVSDLLNLQLESEYPSPVYNAILTKVADLTINLTNLQSQEKNIQLRLEEDSKKVETLEQALESDKLNTKQVARIMGGYQTVYISPAIQPNKPVNPPLFIYTIVGAFLGGVLSVLFVLFRKYIRSPQE